MRQENEELPRRPELDLSRQRVDDLLAAIDDTGWEVAAVPPWPEPLPDPDDEPFLVVAGATGSVLVTGNLRHIPRRLRRGVDVGSTCQLFDQLTRSHRLAQKESCSTTAFGRKVVPASSCTVTAPAALHGDAVAESLGRRKSEDHDRPPTRASRLGSFKVHHAHRDRVPHA
jgi:hypothetical protein